MNSWQTLPVPTFPDISGFFHPLKTLFIPKSLPEAVICPKNYWALPIYSLLACLGHRFCLGRRTLCFHQAPDPLQIYDPELPSLGTRTDIGFSNIRAGGCPGHSNRQQLSATSMKDVATALICHLKHFPYRYITALLQSLPINPTNPCYSSRFARSSIYLESKH